MARGWRIALLGLLFGGLTDRLPAQAWGGPAAFGIEVEDTKGKPVSGAEVELVSLAPGGGGPAPVRTDTRGRVTMFGLAEGPWTISIKHPGFLAYTADLTVLTGKAPKPSTPALLKHSDSLESIRVKFSKAEGPPRARGEVRSEGPRPAPAPPVVKPVPAPAPAPPPAPVTPPPAAPKPSAPAAVPSPTPAPPPVSEPSKPAPTATPSPAPSPAPAPVAPPSSPAPAPKPTPAPPSTATPPAVVPAPPPAPSTPPPATTPKPMPAPPAAPANTAPPAVVAPAPAPPAPAPVPAPPPASAPRLAAPAAVMPLSALPRSARDESCPDCQAGQWAVDVEVVGGSAGDLCPRDLAARWSAVLAPPAVMPAALAGYAGRLRDAASAAWVSALGSDLVARLERELASFLTTGSRCQLAAVLVPAGANYTGFRLRGADGARCSALGECPGGGRFLGPISRVKTEAGLFVAVAYEGTGSAELTVYFAPGTWQVPTGRRR